MKKSLLIAVMFFVLTLHSFAGLNNSRGIIVNPIGIVFGGLSYVEYEHEFSPQTMFLGRFSLVRYSEHEEEIEGYNDVHRYEYDESGFGPGIGGGVRYYFIDEHNTISPYVDVGTDIVMVGWSYKENQYRPDNSIYQTLDGSGTTAAFAFHSGAGIRYNLNNSKINFHGGTKLGTLMLNIERDDGANGSGIGFFFGLVLGVGYSFN